MENNTNNDSIIERLARIETKVDNFNTISEKVNLNTIDITKISEQILGLQKEIMEEKTRAVENEKKIIVLIEQNNNKEKDINEVKEQLIKLNEKHSWAPKIAIGAFITGVVSIIISIFKNGLGL